MKNITIVVNPNGKFRTEGLLRVMVPAPVSPQHLVPPVFGHWYCEKNFAGISRSRTGRYYIRNHVPFNEINNRESMWVGGHPVPPPIAFFFDPENQGGLKDPFLILTEFDLFRKQPDDWYGRGYFHLEYVGPPRDEYLVLWKHA